MENAKIPTIEEIKQFLEAYGWHYRETTADERTVILAPYVMAKDQKGILLSFQIQGEFVMVSTVGYLKNIPKEYGKLLMEMADRVKLCKLFGVDDASAEMINAEIGFELWNEAWNRETFFAFMDMLGMGIDRTMERIVEAQVPHETDFITFT